MDIDSRNAEQDGAVSTNDLIQRAVGGDSEAFADLVHQYHRRVIAYVRGIVGDPETADEISQDVFLAAYQSLDQFAGQSEFSTWLIGIARNKSISALRKQISLRRRQEAAESQLIVDRKLEYLERIDEQVRMSQIETLRECLSKLTPEHRRLLQRHYQDNQTAESIAQELGRSGSGIRMLFLRLRQRLHECISRATV